MEEENILCHHCEIQLTSCKNKKKQTLNKKKFFQDYDLGRVSERFLTGFDMRGQPNHGPIFAQMYLGGFSLFLTSPTFLLALNSR